MEQQRIGELGAVAVARPDRFGEPAQLAPTPCPAFDPLAVVPTRCETGQRPVVLAGARRAGRSVHRDVDLVDNAPAARRGDGRSDPTAPETSRRRRRASRPSRGTRRRGRVARSCRRADRQRTRRTRRSPPAPPPSSACSPATARTTTSPFDNDGVKASTGVSPGLLTIAPRSLNSRVTRRPTMPSPTTVVLNRAPGAPVGATHRAVEASRPCRGLADAAAIAAASASAASTLRRTLTRGAPAGQQEPKGTGSSSAKHVISTAARQAAAAGHGVQHDQGFLKSTVRTADDVG